MQAQKSPVPLQRSRLALCDVFLQISLGEVAERGNRPRGGLCNTHNDMYLACEAIRFLQKDKVSELSKQEVAVLGNYKKSLNKNSSLTG
jgi:hypothetical protein